MKRFSIYILALIFGSITLSAQQKIDPTLEVRREFDGKLMEIIKSKLPTTISDSITRFDLSFDYTVFNKPVRDLYEFSPLPSAQIEKRGMERHPVFQAELAAAFPLAPYANIHYQPNLPEGMTLLLHALHSSYFGKINEIKAPQYNNNAGAAFEYSWEKGMAGINLSGSNELASFYGFSQLIGSSPIVVNPESLSMSQMMDTISRRFNSFNGGIYVRSTNSSPKAFHYLLSADYRYTNDLSRINAFNVTEDYFKLKAEIGPSFSKNHKILASIEFESAESSKSPDFNRMSLTVHPRYLFTQKRWLLEAGVKINKSMEPNSEGFDIYFKGKASISLVPSSLWFYAEADGGTIFRSYGTLLQENNFISQSIELKNTEIPFLGRTGFKGQIMDRFSYHIYGSYTRYRDEIFFRIADEATTSGMINVFQADYASLNKFSAGGELSWKSGAFEAGAKAQYNHYARPDSLPSYNHAPFEMAVHARYNWMGRVSASAEVVHRSSMPVLNRGDLMNIGDTPTETNPFTSLNISARYTYSSKLQFYLKGNNLLNSKGVWLTDYAYRGINIGAGVIITL
ncbi:MAG: hypothetical protein PHV12_05920 [Bacteroidales bacterium]|nr:hypothetical protein [Bacteroidales bacterium]